MGWDYVTRTHDSALLKDVLYDYRFYFAHSYYVKCDMEEDCRAYTDYGIRFDSVIQHGNIYGTQFHPEKSHRFGMVVLKNFLEI